MKTPKEWQDELTVEISLESIEKIQRDANKNTHSD